MIRTSIKWGLFLGITLVIGTQILTWLGLGLTNWFIAMTFMAVAIFSFLASKDLNAMFLNDFTYIKVVLCTMVMIIISRYIFQSYMYIYTNFIDPDWVRMVADKWTNMLEEQQVPESKISQQIAAFQKSYEPLRMFTVEIINIGIPQIILGSIIMAITKWRTKS